MKDAFVIAKHAPGAGNPMQLPIDEFNDYLLAIIEYFQKQTEEDNSQDHRTFVEQQMRKIHR